MRKSRNAKRERNGERGISLFMVAGGMVFLLGVAALAIDVASLYVARDEAQRAADAGALAGAKAFVDTGCVSGGAGACIASQPLAITRATSAAGQNTVGTLPVSSLPGACVSVTFPPPRFSGRRPAGSGAGAADHRLRECHAHFLRESAGLPFGGRSGHRHGRGLYPL